MSITVTRNGNEKTFDSADYKSALQHVNSGFGNIQIKVENDFSDPNFNQNLDNFLTGISSKANNLNIDLSDLNLTDKNIQSLETTIKNNQCLRDLDLNSTPITEMQVEKLQQINPRLEIFENAAPLNRSPINTEFSDIIHSINTGKMEETITNPETRAELQNLFNARSLVNMTTVAQQFAKSEEGQSTAASAKENDNIYIEVDSVTQPVNKPAAPPYPHQSSSLSSSNQMQSHQAVNTISNNQQQASSSADQNVNIVKNQQNHASSNAQSPSPAQKAESIENPIKAPEQQSKLQNIIKSLNQAITEKPSQKDQDPTLAALENSGKVNAAKKNFER